VCQIDHHDSKRFLPANGKSVAADELALGVAADLPFPGDAGLEKTGRHFARVMLLVARVGTSGEPDGTPRGAPHRCTLRRLDGGEAAHERDVVAGRTASAALDTVATLTASPPPRDRPLS
jgi:hypothetical protein